MYFNLIAWLVYLAAVTAKNKITVFRTVDTMPLISEYISQHVQYHLSFQSKQKCVQPLLEKTHN